MSSGAPWFEEQVIGKGTLGHMVQTMAGIDEGKTNHSLKATGVTHMFEGKVTEKIIQKRTGHRNVEHISRPQWCSKKLFQVSFLSPLGPIFYTLKSSVVPTCTGSVPKSSVNLTSTGSTQLPEPASASPTTGPYLHSLQGCTFNNFSFNFGK